MKNETKEKLTKPETWVRLLYMLLFFVVFSICKILLNVLIVFQFVSVLFSGQPNEMVLSFSKKLTAYMYDIMSFLSYNSDDYPFPFEPRTEKLT